MTDHWAENLPEPLVQSIARLNGRLREYGFEYSVKPIRQDGQQMTDDLRTRIAKALWKPTCPTIDEDELLSYWIGERADRKDYYFDQADKLIRELGMKREVERQRQYSWNPNRATQTRWVTDWTTDD